MDWNRFPQRRTRQYWVGSACNPNENLGQGGGDGGRVVDGWFFGGARRMVTADLAGVPSENRACCLLPSRRLERPDSLYAE